MKRSMSYPTQLLLSNNTLQRQGSSVGQQGSHNRRKVLFQKWKTLKVRACIVVFFFVSSHIESLSS